MRPYLRFEKEPRKNCIFACSFFPRCETSPKKLYKLKSSHNISEIYQKKTDFFIKTYFFSPEFQHVRSDKLPRMRPYLRFEKEPRKNCIFACSFFPRCETSPKKLYKLKSSHNISEIYQKKTDFFIKTYFFALNFNMSGQINCRGCGHIYVLKKNRGKIVFLHVVFFLGVKHPLKNCTN